MITANLTELTVASQEIHRNNVEKGFYDEDKVNAGEKLMLIVSELGEALEAHRTDKFFGKDMSKTNRKDIMNAILYSVNDDEFKAMFKIHVKDTYEDEIADAFIRLFDHAGWLGMDLFFHIITKLRYNSLREHKHGKNY